MPSPTPYFDDEAPPQGSPRLFGDMALLSGKRTTAEMRGLSSPSMTDWERRRFRLKMMVVIAYHSGMSQAWIADALGMTQQAVSLICVEIEERLNKGADHG